ncbi:MAG: hypothetical protein WDN69_03410 [Aliidongia sp.]
MRHPPDPPPPEDTALFRPQISTLAGRVIAPPTPGETLVETPIGTLALPLPAPLPLGVSVQLRISAVAPPQNAAPHAAAPHTVPATPEAPPDITSPTLVEELARALAPSSPAAVTEIHAILTLEPGDGLAAAILTVLTGIRQSGTSRGPDSPARRALTEIGRKDLADRLDRARSDIGTTRPPRGADGWTVTVLPFLGPASIRPMRLYRKKHDDKDADGKSRNKPERPLHAGSRAKAHGPAAIRRPRAGAPFRLGGAEPRALRSRPAEPDRAGLPGRSADHRLERRDRLRPHRQIPDDAGPGEFGASRSGSVRCRIP